jgi:hypothetical protein
MAINNKQGEYQVVGAYMCFLHHLADDLAFAVSSGSLQHFDLNTPGVKIKFRRGRQSYRNAANYLM